MAVAGKVAITLSTENGGAWSADVTYDRLVAVKHNNNLYISRKTVANVEPPNDEFWFLALEGFGGEDVESILQAIENIINGSTQVGNAKTLDGHGAEYFAPKEDLAKYLPLTGGVINGNVIVSTAEDNFRTFILQNSVRRIDHAVYAGGAYRVFDNTNGKNIIYSSPTGVNEFNGTASGNLPLNGGMLTGNLYFKKVENGQGMVYKDHNTGNDYGMVLRDDDASGNSVRMLLSALSNAIRFRDTTGTYNDIIHTGNITDYVAADSETGTFTLKLDGVTLVTGTYYKVGKMVHCRATGNFSQSVSTGYASLTGLPFANASLNGSIVDFHTHQYFGKASDNLVFNVGASEISLNVTASIGQNQPFTFSAIYFTE